MRKVLRFLLIVASCSLLLIIPIMTMSVYDSFKIASHEDKLRVMREFFFFSLREDEFDTLNNENIKQYIENKLIQDDLYANKYHFSSAQKRDDSWHVVLLSNNCDDRKAKNPIIIYVIFSSNKTIKPNRIYFDRYIDS